MVIRLLKYNNKKWEGMNQMKKKIIIVFALMVSVLSGGCSSNNKANKEEETASSNQMMAYKVSDANGNYSYLFGTTEKGTKELYPFREEIQAAFDDSSMIATEYNVKELVSSVFGSLSGVSLGSTSVVRTSLINYNLSEEEIEEFMEIARTYTDRSYTFESQYGILVQVGMQETFNNMASQNNGLFIYYDLATNLIDMASDSGKKYVEIKEYSVYEEMLKELNDIYFETRTLEFDTYDNVLAEQKNVYDWLINGKVEELNSYSDSKKDSLYYQYYTLPKTAMFLDSFIDYIESSDVCFFAIDVIQLTGEDGLIKQLEAKGYIIEKI